MARLSIILICGLSVMLFSPAGAQYTFDVEKSLACTPVKNQQRTGTCWSFATSSFIESEMMRRGLAEHDISEMLIVRQVYFDKARNYLLRQGKANFSEGSLSHDVIRTIDRFGFVPERVYPGREEMTQPHDHGELVAVLKGALDALIARGKISDNWPAVVNSILDIYLGTVPQDFLYDGQVYTAKSFAQSVGVQGGEYVSITSFTHHPYYEQFILEIPDNYSNGRYYNVRLDELVQITDHALRQGFTVAWDGDVSEKGFSQKQSLAVLPADPAREDLFLQPGAELMVDASARQRAFESYSTTDDHLMHITGIAHDQNGTRYYLVKNSWGAVGPSEGFLYMSEAYFRMKTVAIMVHRNAVPASIAHKIDL